MKKRTKRYNPNKIKVNANATFNVIKRHTPLTIDEQRSLCKSAITALNAMQFGIDLSTGDFTVLCDVVNVSLVFTELGLGEEYQDSLLEAREALQNSKERYLENGKLGFSKPDLDAVKLAIGIHQAQLERCTFGMFESAFEEQNNRIKKGNFYKRPQHEMRAAV